MFPFVMLVLAIYLFFFDLMKVNDFTQAKLILTLVAQLMKVSIGKITFITSEIENNIFMLNYRSNLPHTSFRIVP